MIEGIFAAAMHVGACEMDGKALRILRRGDMIELGIS